MPRLLKVSTANAAFQRLDVLLRNRTKRHRYGEFVVEGVRAINAALGSGWTIRSFAYPSGRQLSRWASSILEASTADAHLEMAPELFEQISGKDEPSELIAVAEMRPDAVERIPVVAGMTVVVVDRPASPGNLGTLIRSCDALGVNGVIVTGHGVDLYDPATLRASVGAFFIVPCIALSSHREVADWLNGVRRSFSGLTVVGTSARATSSLRRFAWPSEAVIVVGNETTGLSHAYREMCDAVVSIPMRGSATSLNAAIATSIVLYERDAARTSAR
ncbi:MAG TPA: TrmH family RNA methyltransferase [Gemmatimonadaceae bacterium]|nr:TrmH family RNA methyltransferase [Gemmatimonadaceae bacterium]